MIAKPITLQQLKKAIKVAFEGDDKIMDLYDPNVAVKSIEDIAEDIIGKIKDYREVEIKGIFEKSELIGYFVKKGNLLISFGINMKYRVRKFKRALFDLIENDFNGSFVCLLWSKNIRAIRWLENSGMNVIEMDHQLTKLVYKN